MSGLWAGRLIYMRWCGSYITALMMGTEKVPETSVIFNQLTRLIAREDFINVSHREIFRSYKNISCFTALYIENTSDKCLPTHTSHRFRLNALAWLLSCVACIKFNDNVVQHVSPTDSVLQTLSGRFMQLISPHFTPAFFQQATRWMQNI
jgi:hypothetical protein